MERRMFLSQGLTLAATGIVASAAEVMAAPAKKTATGAPGSVGGLHDAARACVGTGEACLNHCFEMMANGNTSMVECARSVREMLLYCDALGGAAAQGSKHLKALAKIALDACNECETQCRKHEKVRECKECADACVSCAKQCKAILG